MSVSLSACGHRIINANSGFQEDYLQNHLFWPHKTKGRNLNVPFKHGEILQKSKTGSGIQKFMDIKLMWTSFYCFSHCARLS